jgi:hypothetical protein
MVIPGLARRDTVARLIDLGDPFCSSSVKNI